MTKIVHFGKYYPPDMGGIESVTETLAVGASVSGYEVLVVCFDKAQTVDGCQSDQVQVVRYPITKMIRSQPLGWKYFWGAVREGRRADIVHLHAPNLLAAMAALFIGPRPKLLIHWHSDVVGKGFYGRLVMPLERLMLSRATKIIATSQSYADYSIPLQKFSKKVCVVPLGVKASDNIPELESLPPRLASFVAGRRLVLSVGRMTKYKGFSVLVEAAKFMNDNVAIIIAGGGELFEDLTTQIEREQLEARVLLAGRVTDAELTSLYQNADVYCMPSIERSEAFGVVLLEAMAYGLPIVATNIPGSGVPWVNEHQVSGLNVTPGDARSLAEACMEILNNPSLMKRFREGARSRFDENFTAATFCKNTLSVYDECLKVC